MMKVNIDEFNKELKKFNDAASNFRPYTECFIKNKDKLNMGFNSDFIDGFKGLLDSMTDTNAPRLLEKAEKLYAAAKKTVESIEEVDKELAKNIAQEK